MQAIIVGLIDPITILSGLAAGVAVRTVGWWLGIAIIVVMAIIESYIVLSGRLYEDFLDHLRLAAIVLPGAAIWMLIGRFVANIALPREKTSTPKKGQFEY